MYRHGLISNLEIKCLDNIRILDFGKKDNMWHPCFKSVVLRPFLQNAFSCWLLSLFPQVCTFTAVASNLHNVCELVSTGEIQQKLLSSDPKVPLCKIKVNLFYITLRSSLEKKKNLWGKTCCFGPYINIKSPACHPFFLKWQDFWRVPNFREPNEKHGVQT